MKMNPHAHLADAVREAMAYDQETGNLTWKSPGKRRRLGQIVGSVSWDGYRHLHVERTHFLAHRVAWLLHYGEWPAQQLDHINGDKADNRIANLRQVNHMENLQNQKRAHKNNKSGFLGVRDRGDGNFWAYIKTESKHKYLGSFKSPEAAHEAYMQAKAKLHVGYVAS